MKAILKSIRISPKKANLVACLVRNKNTKEALDILKFTPKKTAPILKKLIESAIANAKNNNKQSEETLSIKEIVVTEGPTYKRSLPISRGRTHPILKRTSHITVKLETQGKVETEEKNTTKPTTKQSAHSTKTTLNEKKSPRAHGASATPKEESGSASSTERQSLKNEDLAPPVQQKTKPINKTK